MKLNKVKNITALCMALIVSFSPTISVFATDYRDAGSFRGSQDKGIRISNTNDSIYYPNNAGGLTVYVPYNSDMPGHDVFKKMFTGLFNIYKTGVGSNYDSAGARYNAPAGYSNIGGVKTSYFVKKVSLGGLSTNLGPNIEARQADTDLKEFEPNYNVMFRYAGVMINPANGEGAVVTNPGFPSDTLSSSNNGETQRDYQVFDKSGNAVDTVKMFGTSDTIVLQRGWLTKDWSGVSGVPSNIQSTYNESAEVAQKTFELWASRTEIGAEFKKVYSNDPSGRAWWEILNEYMRIDGDYRYQSVLFTVVFNYEGHKYYKTYGIPFPINNNMIASKIQILDDKKQLLDFSERSLTIEEAITGASKISRNVMTDSAVKLELNKTYSIEAAFVYMSKDKDKTNTDKDSAAAAPAFSVFDQTATENKFKEYDGMNASDIEQMSSEERGLLDATTYGPIKTRQTRSIGLTRASSESIPYNMGLTAYKNISFTVDETFPVNGVIRIVIPDTYAQNGDNDFIADDYIDIKYTIGELPPPPDIELDSYGDLNLGQREYRSYHHKVTVAEENPDKPILDEVTGEIIGYEMINVDYEYATDYGWHDSSSEGSKVGKWEGVPEASGSIYPIDAESWWEYDQEWPDQSDDSYYKIWLARGADNWDVNDEEYIRSETAENPFTFGFSVSRSRGLESDSISPNLDVSVYGISPDTDEDGELIESFLVTGNPIGTYDYSSNNYIYLPNNYISKNHPTSGNNDDYPRIRVTAAINKDRHGESGIYGDATDSPYHNGWQDEHDTHERIFEARSDDMELTDVKIKDAEGIVVYHATRENGGDWDIRVKGYFDKEEDYTMSVKLKQTVSSGHEVKNPTIDVTINGENTTGGNVSTYVDRSIPKDGVSLGLDVETTYDHIAFRPRDVSKINFTVRINDIHGSSKWRENIWNANEDSFSDKIQCTTANLKLSPNIELYNSKYNRQNHVSFAERLNFKFDIQHIGEGERQTAIVGNSIINPLAKLDVAIYDADFLTHDEYGNLAYKNVKTFDPKSTGALIWTGNAQAKSRLYPGLGTMNYSTHVQAWINNYVAQSRTTLSGNKAAYGRILVTGNISDEMNLRGLNENTSSSEDYIQQEFIGEHNISIADMVITGQNSISDNSWYYSSANRNKETGELIQENKNGLSVSVAISNMPSSHNDATIIDRTYLDIFVGDTETPTKTMIVDIPQGDTIPVEVIIPDLEITKDLKITAKVNYGAHQTHYEYVLPSTNKELNIDPFTDNVCVKTVSPNLPDKENAPNAEIINGLPPEAQLQPEEG